MAITRGHRFPVEFADAFPQGLVLMGEVAPDTEYRWAAGRPVRQLTGQRQWKATGTGPNEPNAKRVSFEVSLLADVQPVPTTSELLPGGRPIESYGVMAEPRVAGNGEFKCQSSYVLRATGFRSAAAAGGAPKVSESSSKAA